MADPFDPQRDVLALMQRETTRIEASVPNALGSSPVVAGDYLFDDDQFLLREQGFACHYQRGRGLALRLDDPAAAGEMELYIAGSVHAAIASLNGLYPMHASAVVAGERVIAFSGMSGAGKSTLAAALGGRGYPLFCDDALVLDPASDPVMALPGHKRPKLWPEGMALAQVEPLELVSESYSKYFVRDDGSDRDRVLPLAALVYLEDGAELALEPIRGAERFFRIDDDHYTAMLHRHATGMERADLFALRTGLARAIPAYRLTRPFEAAHFGDMVDFVATQLERLAAS